jgi:hypothetical protein
MPEKCKAPDFYLKSALYTFKRQLISSKTIKNKPIVPSLFLS